MTTNNDKPTLNPVLRQFWGTPASIKVLKGGRDSSKCLAKGTPVIMADYSLRNVEDVKVGEQVMGVDGTPRNVLATGQGTEQMYLVKQTYGDDYTVNASHILSLKKRPSDRYPNEPDILNINIEEFIDKSNKFKDNFRGYKSGLIDFPEQDLILEPYFLGVWLGDGCYRNSNVSNSDKEVIDYLSYYADKMSCKLVSRKDSRSNAIDNELTAINNKNAIWDELKALGVAKVRVKAGKHESMKHIPIEYLKSSETQRLQLLAGLLDTDGTYSVERKSYVITQKMLSIADGIKRLCNSLGFRTTTRLQRVKYKGEYRTYHDVSISGDLHRIPCKVARKIAPYKEAKCDYMVNTLKIESVGVGEYYGFTIDGDHLFLLGDHTVTHNTWSVAGHAIALACNYNLKFLCTRQFQNKIQESVYAVLVVQIERFGLYDQFEILKSEIRHKTTGSRFVFYGIHRNIREIKGFEGADILWIEEGDGLTEGQWTEISPTIRKEGSECWIVYNPRFATDFVEKFKQTDTNGILVRQINYDENPFLSETSRQRIEQMKQDDYEKYQHVYLGVPQTDDDKVLIKRSWIDAAINAHIKLGIDIVGTSRIGFDVADSGKDKCSLVVMRGILAHHVETWSAGEDELLESCRRVFNQAMRNDASVVYDSIGVGAFAGSMFNDMNAERKQNRIAGSLSYDGFHASGKVESPDDEYEGVPNKDYFSNIKAQKWWHVADRFRNTYNAVTKGEQFEYDQLISISGDMANLSTLVEELSTPRVSYDKAGRIKLESKDDLEKRGIKSPNEADAFIMATVVPEVNAVYDLLKAVVEG